MLPSTTRLASSFFTMPSSGQIRIYVIPPVRLGQHDRQLTQYQLTFEKGGNLTKDVPGVVDVAKTLVPVPESDATFALRVVLLKELVEKLRSETPLVVKSLRTAAMFVAMDVVYPDPEEWIWKEEEPRHRAP